MSKKVEHISVWEILNSYPPEALKNKQITLIDKNGIPREWFIIAVIPEEHRMVASPFIGDGIYHPDVTENIFWNQLALIIRDEEE